MTLWGFLVFLIVGLIAGWLAGVIMKGRGFGLVGNLVVGVIGSMLGGFLLGLIGLSHHGFRGSIVAALVGACALLFVINNFNKK